ncbi:hypothetical protein ICN48_10310 [Polynucleobacter sp. JS-Safj-400b-B2]|uniref:hypothetical protein n=1 Tax=Polynucleobacter sp. JS-Safj-400b-B2 TaxID=2576921 RepID=UPI001C0B15E7|nr:hypothetical protein [Polynucleobacter sp. JS-Safj-400b-B2]MBU3626621.1 hypothetical protein [Polynucleobacter sp. JS-Safj-400b-B2]
MTLNTFRFSALALTLCIVNGCAAPLAALTTSSTAAASSIGTVAVANPGTAASLASSAATGKSPLEHAASAATKKECSFFNFIDSKPICIEIVLPPVTDRSEPLLGSTEAPRKSAQQ